MESSTKEEEKKGEEEKKEEVPPPEPTWRAKELDENLGEGSKSFTIESGKRIKIVVSSFGATLLSVRSRVGELPPEPKTKE